jgi:hypothetical protein
MTACLAPMLVAALCAAQVEIRPESSTRLYVRAAPQGARVLVDGKPLGEADGLFVVPPGVTKVTIQMEGYESATRQVEITGGRITRLEVELKKQPEGKPGAAAPTPAPSKAHAVPAEGKVPPGAVRLGDVDDTSEGMMSVAGSGHAVAFCRPARPHDLVAVQIFAGRYGTPQPPKEDFHLYLLTPTGELIRDFTFPYAMIARADLRWYTLALPATPLPERFMIGLSFDPHQYKGIYLGEDKTVKASRSYLGLPGQGFSKVEEHFDWMVRAYLVPGKPARAGQASPSTQARPRTEAEPKDISQAVLLSYVGETAEGTESVVGGGHAVAFTRPPGASKLAAGRIFASRFGTAEPPKEDFDLCVLGRGGEVLARRAFPYSLIERGDLRWYWLPGPATEVPQKFLIALAFHPTKDKGIYLGKDTNVKESHSYRGLPGKGFSVVDEKFDWMVRAYLAPDKPGQENAKPKGK